LTWAICIGFLIFAARFGRNQDSAWIRLTTPDGNALYDNSLLGYCHLLGRSPFMKENEPTLHQVAFFSGVRGQEATLDFYALRCGYSIFATALTPLLGTLDALAVTNWLAAVLCVWSVWKLSCRLFNDPTSSCWASLLACLGMGVLTHLGDYSAHLAAFASYFFGIYLIYSSGLIYKRRPWRTHLILGAYCACACLVYKSGIMLTAVYIFAALRHNRWRHVLGAAVLAMSALPVWKYWLTLQGAAIDEVEGDYLRKSLDGWLMIFHLPWFDAAKAASFRVSQFLLFDSPLVVCLGLASMLMFRQRLALRWFGLLVVGLPVASALVFVNSASARGYLVYGISIWFYCWLGRLLALASRAQGGWRKAGAYTMILLVLGSHAAWTTAQHWRQLGPVKGYVLGWDNAWFHFRHGPTKVLSLTDGLRTPSLWGGLASLDEAGAALEPSKRPVAHDRVSFRLALGRRWVCYGYIAMFALTVVSSLRRRLVVGCAVASICLVSCGLSAATFRNALDVHDITGSFVLGAREKVILETEVGQAFRHALQAAGTGGQMQIFLLADDHAHLRAQVHADTTCIPVQLDWLGSHAWQPVDGQFARTAVCTARHLSFEIENCSDQPVHMGAWQRNALPGRAQHFHGSDKPSPLQLGIEIRVMRPDKTYALVGF
jgi:hypothetical protein